MLARYRAHQGSLTRAAFLSARNDAVANVAIVAAGLMTVYLASAWPDLSANEACPAYPAKTTRLHVSFPDPSRQELKRWREVRDALGGMSRALVETIAKSETPTESLLVEAGKLPEKGLTR